MIERLLTQPYFSKGWYFRLTLLIGQSLSMGITLSLLIITANSLFLVDFGPQMLPYVYIVVAFAGSLLSYGAAAMQSRWSLAKLAITTIAGLAVFYLLSWLGITLLSLRWISFALVVSFSLVIQIGFVFLGGQAGRLLDLRQIKRLFPQIVAGFVVGFLLGAMAIPILVVNLGSTENVLLVLVVSTLVWLAFLVVTSRRFPAELNQVSQSSKSGKEQQSFLGLLRKPYVQLLFVYQVLAAIVNQLSDFFLLALSSQQYDTSAGLAQFFSQFTVALNVTDLLITTLIAGIFLSRFGLGAGLLSNPLVMGVLFAAMIVTAPLLGISSSLFFMLVVVARIASISLTDGTTRASVNTTYQALPAHERIQVQTGVEGIGMPIALGLVGVILLGFNALQTLTLFHLVLLAAAVVGAWIFVGWKVYLGYKTSLVKMVGRRRLAEAEFSLEDHSTLKAVRRLLHSDEPHHVIQALDVLESAEHDSLNAHLSDLLRHPAPKIRMEALARIERRQVAAALLAVEKMLDVDFDPETKGAAIRALSALSEDGAAERLAPFLEDAEPVLRRAAMTAMLQYGGIAGTLAAGQALLSLQASPDPMERILAAQVIGEVGARNYYQPLLPLLRDPDCAVRVAALVAAGKAPHKHLLEAVAANLGDPATHSAAASVLITFGTDILPILENALSGKVALNQKVVRTLLRVSGQLRVNEVIMCLKGYIGYADDEIRHQILISLMQNGYRAAEEDLPSLDKALRYEIEQGLRLLQASDVLGNEATAQMLQRALAEALDLVRHRILLNLSFQYDAQTILGAWQRLSARDESKRALAMEILDISLRADMKTLVFPLLDPNLQPAQRITQLKPIIPQPGQSREAYLQEMISNSSGAWPDEWVRACALYTAARLSLAVSMPAIGNIGEDAPALVRETAAWALSSTANG